MTTPQKQPARRASLRQRAQSTRDLGRKGTRAASWVAAGRRPYTARGMLTAELLIGVGIVALRAVADYAPQQDGTLRGKIGHPKGQYGPLPVLAGLIMTFFLLSFLAARGGTRAKVGVIAGGLIVLVLAMKSLDEFETVATTFGSFGTAKPPPGDWQTTGAQAGSPITSGGGTASPPGSGGTGSRKPFVPAKNGKCPKGYTYNASADMCVINPGPPEAG